jgi:hypothetical protein
MILETDTPTRRHEEPSWQSSNWPVAIGWLCFGLYSILSARLLVLGAGQIGVAVAYASDEILAKRAPSKSRLNLVRLFAVAVFLATILTKLFPSAK